MCIYIYSTTVQHIKMPFFCGKWGFVLFHHRLFFSCTCWEPQVEPDNFAGSRVEQYRLYFSVTRTARLFLVVALLKLCVFFPPFYREHRKRLQQSKVGSVLLSLVEISNNTFGVDVMMCGPPVGWKSSNLGAFWWVTESWIYCSVH